MSRPRVLILIAGMLVALVALVALAAPTRAANEVATRISIRPLDPVTVGVYLRVTVDLTLANGAPLADQPVTLTMNDVPVHRTRTDLNGIATFRLGKDLAPGEYVLTATYEGETDAYFGATARSTLVVVPFGLTVETVPPLPGMVFELDGTRFVAGDDGIARIAVAIAGDHELAVIEDAYRNPDQRAEFSRWNSEYFGPRISIRIPHSEPLQAGFDLSYRASQVFVDLDGSEVDPSRVTALTLRSSLGAVYTYDDGQARWFKASRAVRRPRGVESVEVTYNVQSVEVDGSNVVNAGQQRFLVTAGATWEIELLLFSAHLTGHDALFGFPIGESVDVTYPNGVVVRVEPDENGELWARWLARGDYRMTVADAPGWAPVIPVALSRDQEVQLRVISFLDMGAAALAGLGLALGLLHLGRPHLVPAWLADASRGYGRIVRLSLTLSSRLAFAARTGIAIVFGSPTRTVPGATLPSRVGAVSREVVARLGRRTALGPVRSNPSTVPAASTAVPAVSTAGPTAEGPPGSNGTRRDSSEREVPRTSRGHSALPEGKLRSSEVIGPTEARTAAGRDADTMVLAAASSPASQRARASTAPMLAGSNGPGVKPTGEATPALISAEQSTAAPKAAARKASEATDAAPTERLATVAAPAASGTMGKAPRSGKARGKAKAKAKAKAPKRKDRTQTTPGHGRGDGPTVVEANKASTVDRDSS